jgi:hypothetical protein
MCFFRRFPGLVPLFPRKGGLFPVPFQGPVDSGRAYTEQIVLDVRCNAEGRPVPKKGYLVPDEESQDLPAPVQKKARRIRRATITSGPSPG